jgi:hypothetical protein
MIALGLCLLAFLVTFVAGRLASWLGLFVTIAVGYFYGILRANIQSPVSHFIFDAALVGLYSAHFLRKKDHARSAMTGGLRTWTIALLLWPLLVCLLPYQSLLVTLVGLRGNTFLLPLMLIGASLTRYDLSRFSLGLACLNLVAMAFAIAQYFLGIERFFPQSAVTEIMYRSQDVAGYRFFRIPSTFLVSAAYGGTMVATLVFLFGSWIERIRVDWHSIILIAGMVSAGFGVLLSASRSHFVVGCIVALTAVFAGTAGTLKRLVWILVLIGLTISAMSNERFQRFQNLAGTEALLERARGSINRTFMEILTDYPLGNGLGGGGTSLPYFLRDQVKTPISMENEYARIQLEQGFVGLLLWLSFIIWVLKPSSPILAGGVSETRRMAWYYCVCSFGTGLIGIGLLTSIPQSALFLLMVGYVATCRVPEWIQVPGVREQTKSAGRRMVHDMPGVDIADGR